MFQNKYKRLIWIKTTISLNYMIDFYSSNSCDLQFNFFNFNKSIIIHNYVIILIIYVHIYPLATISPNSFLHFSIYFFISSKLGINEEHP